MVGVGCGLGVFCKAGMGRCSSCRLAKEKLTHAGLDSEEKFCSEIGKRLVPFHSVPWRCGALRYCTVT